MHFSWGQETRSPGSSNSLLNFSSFLLLLLSSSSLSFMSESTYWPTTRHEAACFPSKVVSLLDWTIRAKERVGKKEKRRRPNSDSEPSLYHLFLEPSFLLSCLPSFSEQWTCCRWRQEPLVWMRREWPADDDLVLRGLDFDLQSVSGDKKIQDFLKERVSERETCLFADTNLWGHWWGVT